MNFLLVFLKGLLIGFSIAAPVGPIGVLCIRRSLSNGRVSGFVSGLGAASADAIYGSIAAFGLTFISTFLVSQQGWLRLLGGVFLVFLGFKTLLARPAQNSSESAATSLFGDYSTTFFLTLTNPMTILSFTAIFAGLGIANAGGDYLLAVVMVLGVFCGSTCWWLLLSGGVSLFRHKLSLANLVWVNRLSGVIILSFGGLALWGWLRLMN